MQNCIRQRNLFVPRRSDTSLTFFCIAAKNKHDFRCVSLTVPVNLATVEKYLQFLLYKRPNGCDLLIVALVSHSERLRAA